VVVPVTMCDRSHGGRDLDTARTYPDAGAQQRLLPSRAAQPVGFRVVGRDVAKFHLVLDGHAWLVLDQWEPLRVSSGDLVILPHGSAHAMKDQPESKVEALDQVLQAHPLDRAARLHYGGKGAGTRMLCGGFGLRDSAPQVLARLPEVLTIDARSGPVGSWTEAVGFVRPKATAQSIEM
jgi:mannose-6-phosphate isomerase-like protein (cupin superfamily)